MADAPSAPRSPGNTPQLVPRRLELVSISTARAEPNPTSPGDATVTHGRSAANSRKRPRNVQEPAGRAPAPWLTATAPRHAASSPPPPAVYAPARLTAAVLTACSPDIGGHLPYMVPCSQMTTLRRRRKRARHCPPPPGSFTPTVLRDLLSFRPGVIFQ